MNIPAMPNCKRCGAPAEVKEWNNSSGLRMYVVGCTVPTCRGQSTVMASKAPAKVAKWIKENE